MRLTHAHSPVRLCATGLLAGFLFSHYSLYLYEIKSQLDVLAEVEDPTCARLAQNYALMIAPPSGQGLIKSPQAGPQRTGPASDPSQMRNPAPRAQGSNFAQAYRAAYDKCRATKS